jgi:ribosomal protein S18 acetylase RimI-like enzyme
VANSALHSLKQHRFGPKILILIDRVERTKNHQRPGSGVTVRHQSSLPPDYANVRPRPEFNFQDFEKETLPMTKEIAMLTDIDSLSSCMQKKARQFMHSIWEEEQAEFGWIDSSFLTHQSQSRRVWVGHYAGVCVSFVVFKTRQKKTQIIQLGVHPELRRIRLGSSLLGHVERVVLGMNNPEMSVRVSSAHPSVKFFDHCGYLLHQVQLEKRARQVHISVLRKDLNESSPVKTDDHLTARIRTRLDPAL